MQRNLHVLVSISKNLGFTVFGLNFSKNFSLISIRFTKDFVFVAISKNLRFPAFLLNFSYQSFYFMS